jgi:hypothetical protein
LKTKSVLIASCCTNADRTLQVGKKVRLDSENAETEDLESLPPTGPRVLVQLNGSTGSIRGPGLFIIRTELKEAKEYKIIIRSIGQSCLLLRKPSVRFFRVVS